MGLDLHKREGLQAAAAVGGASSAEAAGGPEGRDMWVADKFAARDFSGLRACSSAPNARLVHPTTENFFPLHFVLGSALPEDRVTPDYEGFHHRTLSMRSFALRT